jgi:large subunit ribosomal protein L6
MSRVGKEPIIVPEGVKVTILMDKIELIKANLSDNMLTITRENDSDKLPAYHGLCRTLAFNSATGVSTGFTKRLEIVGVGYRARLDNDRLELNLGYSKPILYQVPDDIEIVLEKPTLIIVKGIDKQRVGQEAHRIRSFRKPDPYKLKGVRYVGERLIKKERKAGVTSV